MAKEESRGSAGTLEMQDMYILHKFCSECIEFSIEKGWLALLKINKKILPRVSCVLAHQHAIYNDYYCA